MTMVIVISLARERKTAPNVYAPGLLTRIVQSPTKLNELFNFQDILLEEQQGYYLVKFTTG